MRSCRLAGFHRLASAGAELPEASSSSSSQKRGDKAEKEKGKGKRKQVKNPSRGKVFTPERLVSKLDSALDFVSG